MTKRKLQSLINASIKGNNAAHMAERFLVKYCVERWGFDPGEEDVDWIIDGCMGGCGFSSGFSADEFIREMDAKKAEIVKRDAERRGEFDD